MEKTVSLILFPDSTEVEHVKQSCKELNIDIVEFVPGYPPKFELLAEHAIDYYKLGWDMGKYDSGYS